MICLAPLMLSLLPIFVTRTSLAMDQAEYQNSLRNLQDSQRDAKKMIAKLGIRSGSSLGFSPAGESSKEDHVPRTLFVLHDDAKRLRAAPGKFLFGIIHNRLIVGGESSPAVIQLSQDQGLFSGLRVLGIARPSGTEGRMALDLNRVITRQGSAIPIKAVAQDESGGLGLEAQVFSSKAIAVAGAMASSFVSGLAASQQTQTATAFGFSQVDRTGRNGVLQGVAQTAADQSKRLIEEATQEKPVLVVEAGTPVTVFLDEEVRF